VDGAVRRPASGRAAASGRAGGRRLEWAPARPAILRKAIITTIVSAVIFVAIFALERSDLVSFRSEWLAIPD
jgi:predicted secreted protein